MSNATLNTLFNLKQPISPNETVNTFYNLSYTRRSIREFSDKPIENDVLNRLLTTLHRAPSAANRQPWLFYVIKGKLRPAFNAVFKKEAFHDAPLVIAACALPDEAWKRTDDNTNFAWVDVTIALTDMINAATAEGIGSCWVASFEFEKAQELLELPPKAELVSLVVFGYPKKPLELCEKNRKNIEDVIIFR